MAIGRAVAEPAAKSPAQRVAEETTTAADPGPGPADGRPRRFRGRLQNLSRRLMLGSRFGGRLLTASVLCAAFGVAAFAGGERQPGAAGAVREVPPTPPVSAAPADQAKLAARIGCALHPATSNADFEQGVCTSSTGRVVLVTFTTAVGQQQWKSEAESYGQYLVGPRWVVGGDPALLVRLRSRLGGVLEGSTAHRHSG